MDSQAKHIQRWQAEQAQQYSNKVFNDLWEEALKEEGIDGQAYSNLASQDPEYVKAELKKSMKTLVGNVKKGRNAKGQFVRQTQTPHGGNVPQTPNEYHAKVDHYKEVAKKRPLTDDEGIDVLDALFGGTDPL
jgi:hypothetical protein